MHDIWNPWHGCTKKSPGCEHCYMYFLDKQRGHDGAAVYRVKNNFDYPLHKNADGTYKIQSGETLRVCLTSDFFLDAADAWRDEAWRIIKQRPDVKFQLLTKRPERVSEHLPSDWGDGYENVMLSVTAENQEMADERIPILLNMPFKHMGVMVAPFIGPVYITKYLYTGKIEQVLAGGENYDGARPLNYDWVKSLYDSCVATNTTFCFIETGNKFIKDGKEYNIPSKRLQSEQAYKSGLQFMGREIKWNLTAPLELFEPKWYKPYFGKNCEQCAYKMLCNGCSRCGKCDI
ncbi:MAG: DUF5131 family protein [Alphaproteobacteria bacterium]|nr:DUF5131 family protein [Alphaproteobacteria bacterium]